ncbi:hypothetical protein SAMN04489806_1558 [Paramicrobacterium humi]|uniref:Uncharacterized protein n=1 Tax=Paramicrobacterium humi TaxID=640635 RepID=A0A1H4LIU0_9MICO|nr:hypothetical protein SAMN04489806_1558 [Microbacterium humi]
MGEWSKSRIIFLAIGVILVGVGVWMILPSLFN